MTMLAARWHGRRDIRLDTVPVPRRGPGEVLVRVERVGLCGSDVEEFQNGPVGIPAAPLTLGHEIVGVVAESADSRLPPGTAVVPDVVVGCGQCWWCARHEEGLCPRLSVRGQQQDGGLAEFMLADAATCIPVPAGLDLEVAAFAEPTAVAVRALRKVGDLAGTVVCVYGAGTVGQLVIQVALVSGCSAVVAVDPVADRRRLAANVGATACLPENAADAVAGASSSRGADVVVECAGVPGAPAAALSLCRRGGTVVLVGFRPGEIALPWLDVVLGERTILGSAAHLWDIDVAGAVALLHRGLVDPRPLHTATLPLDEVPAAFDRLAGDRSVLKLLIAP